MGVSTYAHHADSPGVQLGKERHAEGGAKIMGGVLHGEILQIFWEAWGLLVAWKFDWLFSSQNHLKGPIGSLDTGSEIRPTQDVPTNSSGVCTPVGNQPQALTLVKGKGKRNWKRRGKGVRVLTSRNQLKQGL